MMNVKPAAWGFVFFLFNFILIKGLLSQVLSPLNCSPLSQDIGEALVHRPHDSERFGNVPLRGLQYQLHGCPGPAASAVLLDVRHGRSPEEAAGLACGRTVVQMDF